VPVPRISVSYVSFVSCVSFVSYVRKAVRSLQQLTAVALGFGSFGPNDGSRGGFEVEEADRRWSGRRRGRIWRRCG
jgi:hypothetical protein